MKKIPAIARRIHLWAGLILGLIATVSGITGSLYVWQPEVTSLLNPELLHISGAEKNSEEKLHHTASLLAELHRDSARVLNFPYGHQQSFSLLFKNGKTFYFDIDGKLLGEKSASIHFFETLLKIHRTLGIPVVGKYITGGSSVLFFILVLISGFILWRKKSKIKRQKKQDCRIKNGRLSLHSKLGIFFLLPLAVLALTGSFFTFSPVYKNIFGSADVNTDALSKDFSATMLLKNPLKEYKLKTVYLNPGEESYHFRYVSERYNVTGLRKTKEIKININNVGTTDYISDPLGARISAQIFPVHTGALAGYAGRSIVFIAGFIPFILYATALWAYFKRLKIIH